MSEEVKSEEKFSPKLVKGQEMRFEITPKVVEEAGYYIDNRDCLVATLLKHAGFTNPNAGSCSVSTDEAVFELSCDEGHRIDKEFYGWDNKGKVSPSAIGKTVTMTVVAVT